MATPGEIVQLLHERRALRKRDKEVRTLLLKACVECGLPQADAMTIKVDDWLDGWLVARGVIQDWRDERP